MSQFTFVVAVVVAGLVPDGVGVAEGLALAPSAV
jgi:hypothetical protein